MGLAGWNVAKKSFQVSRWEGPTKVLSQYLNCAAKFWSHQSGKLRKLPQNGLLKQQYDHKF